jgi:transcription elongation GreA/GreB family factor
VDCPLARALLGKRVGDRMKVRVPGGFRGVIVESIT